MATGAARQRTLTLRRPRPNGGGCLAPRALALGLLLGALALCGCTSSPAPPARAGLSRIDHIVVIYAENRSFDHLYGLFPGADGIANASPAQYTQLDHDGKPLPHLPPVWTADGKPDTRFPTMLPNRPFRIDAPPVSQGLDKIVPSPIHQFWQNQETALEGLKEFADGWFARRQKSTQAALEAAKQISDATTPSDILREYQN